jgi:hypothetical protein
MVLGRHLGDWDQPTMEEYQQEELTIFFIPRELNVLILKSFKIIFQTTNPFPVTLFLPRTVKTNK